MILLKERVGKLISCIQELIYSQEFPIQSYHMLKTDERIEDIDNLDTSSWKTMKEWDIWGGHREYYYFETVMETPAGCEGKTLIYELKTGKEGEWDALNPQFLAYVNGKIKQGLDVNHREILLTEKAQAGEPFRIVLAAFSGDNNFSLHLESKIKVLERNVEKYYYDISVPYEVARLLNTESSEYIEIIQCLNESLNLLDLRKRYTEAFYQSLQEAQNYITEEFYNKRCGHSKEVVCCVGHTHIDCAWLWTLKTTQDKAVRSFSTVLELMKRYPEYKFMSSQPQLYDYVKKNAPEIYKEIQERVAEGRWETEGGMWVEADCNIASGESLVRQFLYGLQFFKREFDKTNEILWLPDVFGYSAALPQIMKKCGIHYFMTTKISWNEFNKMPYDTFMWEGIDGTEVLTHFSSSRDYLAGAVEGGTETEHFTTYNAMLDPSMVKGNWKRYSQKELHTESLMSYGYGDGGGGPTEEMLENQRRLEKGIPGCPRTKQSHALEFFHQLEKDVTGNRFLPKWMGELYLEYHRGTYTSMARNKKFNRKSEFAYENIETYAVLAQKLLKRKYPKEDISESWEVILRNQFHDILPGSSIKEVYDDSKVEYELILEKAATMTNHMLSDLADHVAGNKGDLVVFNPNSTAAGTIITIPEGDIDVIDAALDDGKHQYRIQKTEHAYVAYVKDIPSKGYKTYRITSADRSHDSVLIKSIKEIETPYFHIKLNDKGQFTSIWDKKAEREIIPEGQVANQIISYEDKPHNYDAWDINNYYTEKSWEVDDVTSMEIVENGPVRGCIRIVRHYLDSEIAQYIYVYKDLDRIDIRNEIDWKEEQILLRDYFPVAIHSDEATFEIQYGNVKRPTHSNTMWDFAKFEVCAHKWLDFSEDGYGISVLNDCKYGCSVRDGVIGLSMLKSALYPNPDADKEYHTFWYAICPHEGDFRQGRTVEKAYVFNNPVTAIKKQTEGGTLPGEYSYVSVEEPNIIVEVVKQEEQGTDTIIRLYETFNRRGKIHIHVKEQFDSACECNMLEEKVKELPAENGVIMADILPYEIKTIKISSKTEE